jgi:hypothetical protein
MYRKGIEEATNDPYQQDRFQRRATHSKDR